MKTQKEIKKYINDVKKKEIIVEELHNKTPHYYLKTIDDVNQSIKNKHVTEWELWDIVEKMENDLSKTDFVYIRSKEELNNEKDRILAFKWLLS